jgi:hypothetical protein
MALSAGCTSAQAVQRRLEAIEQRHGVKVVAGNPLSRCYLFGNLPGLLDRIDRDLAEQPQFFKENLGPIIIQETFLDNPATYPFPFLVRGYVDPKEQDARFPVHIKNRSLLERLVFFAPRNGELFLHEASHSFEFNVYTFHPEKWRAFFQEFEEAGGPLYLPRYAGAIVFTSVVSLVPPVGYLRVPGMPSIYACLNHFEDFAVTSCYLARHGGNVEFLKESDAALLGKCRAVQRLLAGLPAAEPPSVAPSAKPDGTLGKPFLRAPVAAPRSM